MRIPLVARALAAVLPLGVLPAQVQNVNLLDTLSPRSVGYNEVWGYVTPSGDEYALLGSIDGTTVVDCRNPRNIVATGFIPGVSSTWRDIRTYGPYAYVSTEGAGGIQVIDLSNPQAPVLVTTFGAQYFGNAHNVCIDLGTGRLYAVGTNAGNVVFDLTTNPTNPAYVGTWDSGGSAWYNHDMCVENGYAYGSMIYNGVVRINDVSVFPPLEISRTSTPATFTHNAWPNAAGTLLATTDERTGGVVQLYDITNKAAPVALGNYTPNTAAIPHNAFIVGDTLHVSFYTEGYRAVDISDPNNPVEIGYYDTWPGPSGGFSGNWGVYPFQPSGTIYVSDRSTGLYVVELNRLTVSATALGDTVDEVGPYDVVASVTSGGAPVSAVDLHWSVDGGATFAQVPMSLSGGSYAGSIPGQDAPTTVTYFVAATNPNGSGRSSTYEFFVGTRVVVYAEDFEAGDGGYTHGTVGPQDDWQYGTPAGQAGDPLAAASGASCWANDLGQTGWNGAYANNTDNYLDSPAIPTGGAQGLKLRFSRWLTVEDGQYDQATIYVNGNQVWQNPTGSNLLDTSWQTVEYDISAIANAASTVQIRWQLQADAGNVFGGWNVDDVQLLVESDCVPPVHYGTGTAGTGGFVPTIDTLNAPALGSANFAVNGADMVGGGFALLLLGLGEGNVPALGATVLLDPMLPVDTFLLPVSGAAGAAGVGTASQGFVVPNTPVLDNTYFYLQWVPLDVGGPGGVFSASDGMRIRVCQG